jgi:hypothetical protein
VRRRAACYFQLPRRLPQFGAAAEARSVRRHTAMISGNSINSAGLLLDIIGAWLLWRYGLPEPISKTGAVHLIAEQTDQAEIDKATRYERWARIGMTFLILGFALQLISNYWPSAA